MIPRKIHQVYGLFNDGKSLQDIPIFHQQVSKTKQYCITNDIEYKMWDNTDCNELIAKYPQYKELYENFRFPVQKADFVRYLILYDTGGIYVDCDIAPIGDMGDLFEMNEFFVIWNNDKKLLPYNAVLGTVSKNILYEDIFKQIQHDYPQKLNIDVYKTWTGRFVFQTTGHFMLNRVLKRYPDIQLLDILKIHNKGGEIISDVCPIFEDYNLSTWFMWPIESQTKYIINLDRQPEKLINHKSYIRWSAIDGTKIPLDTILNSKSYVRYNTKENKRRGVYGCLMSHINLLQHIVDKKIDDVCVLEDDSTSDFIIPDDLKNADHITYLGGFIINKKMKDFKLPVEERTTLVNGINKLYNARVMTTRSYYIPKWIHAENLLNYIHSKKCWRAIDVMMSEYVTHLYYPALSKQIVGFESTIGNNNPTHEHKFY